MLASPSLTQRLRDGSAALPPREALIVRLLLAHPELIGEHAEELALLDFAASAPVGRELGRLRDCLLDLSHGDVSSPVSLRADLAAAGFATLLSRLDSCGNGSAWYLDPEAAAIDAAFVLRQALTLHHKARALHKELLSAETALATDASEANLARMRDIQEQLSALTGSEASIEGFGASSGRVAVAI